MSLPGGGALPGWAERPSLLDPRLFCRSAFDVKLILFDLESRCWRELRLQGWGRRPFVYKMEDCTFRGVNTAEASQTLQFDTLSTRTDAHCTLGTSGEPVGTS